MEEDTKMDEKVYGKFIDPLIGYGVFAKKPLEKDEVVGFFSAEIVEKYQDLKYSWTYPSKVTGTTELHINAQEAGNLMKYVNDVSNHNIRPKYFFYNN